VQKGDGAKVWHSCASQGQSALVLHGTPNPTVAGEQAEVSLCGPASLAASLVVEASTIATGAAMHVLLRNTCPGSQGDEGWHEKAIVNKTQPTH
jgi:hypothetical protein